MARANTVKIRHPETPHRNVGDQSADTNVRCVGTLDMRPYRGMHPFLRSCRDRILQCADEGSLHHAVCRIVFHHSVVFFCFDLHANYDTGAAESCTVENISSRSVDRQARWALRRLTCREFEVGRNHQPGIVHTSRLPCVPGCSSYRHPLEPAQSPPAAPSNAYPASPASATREPYRCQVVHRRRGEIR